MERSNQAPKPECCLVEGQGKVRRKDPTRTTAGKRTQGKARAASGSRVLLKQFSFDTAQNAGGDGVRKSEPKTDETATGEVLDGLPGQRAWHAKKKTHGTGEALKSPAALTARAKRVRRHNDKKCLLMGFRDSDRFIIPSGKAGAPKLGKGPTR
jgi:hypothetical protein